MQYDPLYPEDRTITAKYILLLDSYGYLNLETWLWQADLQQWISIWGEEDYPAVYSFVPRELDHWKIFEKSDEMIYSITYCNGVKSSGIAVNEDKISAYVERQKRLTYRNNNL